MYPEGISFGELVSAGLQLERDGKAEDAQATWAITLERYPDEPNGYSQSGWFFRRARRFAEADAVLAQAAAKFPDDLEVLLDWAWVAGEGGDWATAATRFREISAAHDEPRALEGLAEALFSQRAYREADAMLSAATRRYPQDLGIARAYAACASQEDRKLDALQRWRSVHRRFPEDLSSVAGLARALTDTGDFEDARALLSDFIARHPAERALLEAQANLATISEDWPAAISGWRQLATAYPEDIRLRDNQAAAEQAARLAGLSPLTSAPPAA